MNENTFDGVLTHAMSSPRDERMLALIDDLRAQAAETSLAEFKENYDAPAMIGKLISGISNAARIAKQDSGYVVWGVRDADHAVVGTTFDPATAKHQRQPLEFWLHQRLRPGVAFSFQAVEHPQGRIVLLEIPAAPTAPVEFEHMAYDRIGSATPRLADNPHRQQALWEQLRPYAWETGVAQSFASEDAVLALLDVESCFRLLRLPTPDGAQRALSVLEQHRLISPDAGGKWNISNLGAILLAKDLRDFEPNLARKAIRFVAYDGDGRTATVTHREDFFRGYANGFEDLNAHVNTLLPAREDGNSPIRDARTFVPAVAIREVVANALIHQDMSMAGTGPTIELFRNRLEITNPGKPLVAPERFIDFPPRSRNQALASLMRRFGLCEEMGTGVDKVIAAAEEGRLPPPEFQAQGSATRTILFGPRRFAQMTTEERRRACYQHTVLRFLGDERMRNATLRERFGVAEHNAAQISGVIRLALDADLIRPADRARPRSGYVPHWA